MKRIERLLLALVVAGAFAFGLFGVGAPQAEAACKVQCCPTQDGGKICWTCCQEPCPTYVCPP